MKQSRRMRVALDRALELTVVGSFSRFGYAARRALFDWDATPDADLAGRVVAVTGATSGLGFAVANDLVRRGVEVVLVGRDPERTRAARGAILESVPGACIETVVADLASLDSVRAAAAALTAVAPRLDALVHNAGTLVHRLQRTEDGIEVTAQVHVVAPFLLTTLLLPALHASEDPRVITVSSGGMYGQRLDVPALEAPHEPFNGVRAYANAKRAQVVINERWSRHPAGRGIAFHAMHPGWADTPGVRASLPGFARVARPFLRSAEQGVDTMVWLVGTPEARESNGDFWLDRRRRPTSVVPWTRTPDDRAEQLWSWCVARSGAHIPVAATS